jgi:hypothetical protein
LVFFAGLVVMPVGLADNTVLVSASLTGEDGLACATWVQLTRVAGRRETESEVGVCCEGCPDGCTFVPRSSMVRYAVNSL